MDTETIRWAIGILLSCIGGLVWYEIRRVGANVHKLRSEVGTMVLNLETQVRAVERDVAELKGRQIEAGDWRDMVMVLLRGRQA